MTDHYTEDEIRAAMERHGPGNEGYCLCSWGPGNAPSMDFVFDVDHLMDVLRANREASQ
jgi:hypothetical protein